MTNSTQPKRNEKSNFKIFQFIKNFLLINNFIAKNNQSNKHQLNT